MDLGREVLLKVIDIVKESNFGNDKNSEIFALIAPYINSRSPGELDIATISKLEALLGETILVIPTKQEWRKIKLDRLNKI